MAAVQLSIVTPAGGTRIWRNPESPPAANGPALRAMTPPHVPQVVWYVDGEPFALGDPDVTVIWPLRPGKHRFQIGLPLQSERSRTVHITIG
ncbi:MAG: hypothetical protein ACJ8AW_13375 [Rhodopila sp.]